MFPKSLNFLFSNSFKSVFLFFARILTLDYSREREELKLRCQEKKLQRQVEVIKGALSELGCDDELPSGCDLSMEGSFTDSSTINKVSNFNNLFN